ncbi:hypothetical protein [Paenibacillus roseipurpureus]|uniref:Uncharacterized protein n=1 Tax=Paenibacillus roseopurpureus TaxID=2918901 RepID=A0AA96LNQ6_9BACL|nr:hypothetical protein [Paenibacillus sp. MBLB1832]WNR44414.1 hypothetical protein MJB10_25685 [Paenibacillus sp. MBLB1832]
MLNKKSINIVVSILILCTILLLMWIRPFGGNTHKSGEQVSSVAVEKIDEAKSFSLGEALRLGYEEARKHTEEEPLLIDLSSTDSSSVPQKKTDGMDGKRNSWNMTFGTKRGSIHISIEINNGLISVPQIANDNNNGLRKGMYALSDIQVDSPQVIQKAIEILGIRPGDPAISDDWIKGFHFSIAPFQTNPSKPSDTTLLLEVTGISPHSPNSKNESLRMIVYFNVKTGEIFNASEMMGYDKDGRTTWKAIDLIH